MNKLAEKVAAAYVVRTTDPEVRQMDILSIIALIMAILESILPLLEDFCPTEDAEVKDLAHQMQPMVGLSWRRRRQRFPLLLRWQYALFHRRCRAGVGESAEVVDRDEIEVAMLDVCQGMTLAEIARVRAGL